MGWRRRNQLMLDDGRPDLVVAFPGGKGTADMANRATSKINKFSPIDGVFETQERTKA